MGRRRGKRRLTADGEIHGRLREWRLGYLQAVLRSTRKDEAGLPALFELDDERAFLRGDVDLHYAAARYLGQYLEDQGLLWDFYKEWRRTQPNDPRGEAAFEKVVGESPAQRDAKWRSWVLAIQPPAARSGPGGE
jgi:hypothetical protein